MHEKLTEIEVKNMRVRAILGFKDWEREKKQDIVVSFRFDYQATAAISDDRVDRAIDYKTITKRILRFVAESYFYLIDCLADTIFKMVSAMEGDENTHVKVEKPN